MLTRIRSSRCFRAPSIFSRRRLKTLHARDSSDSSDLARIVSIFSSCRFKNVSALRVRASSNFARTASDSGRTAFIRTRTESKSCRRSAASSLGGRGASLPSAQAASRSSAKACVQNHVLKCLAASSPRLFLSTMRRPRVSRTRRRRFRSSPKRGGAASCSSAPSGPQRASRMYYTILYYTILYYTILYYTILYYTTLRPISLCCTPPEWRSRCCHVHFLFVLFGLSESSIEFPCGFCSRGGVLPQRL